MLVYQRVITNYNHQYYFFSLTSGDGQPPGGPRRLPRLVEGFRQAKDLSFFSHFLVGNSGFVTEKTWDIHHPAELVRGCTRRFKKQLKWRSFEDASSKNWLFANIRIPTKALASVSIGNGDFGTWTYP